MCGRTFTRCVLVETPGVTHEPCRPTSIGVSLWVGEGGRFPGVCGAPSALVVKGKFFTFSCDY